MFKRVMRFIEGNELLVVVVAVLVIVGFALGLAVY